MLRHTIGADSRSRAVLSQATDWMERKRALWGRLFDIVDEYLREDRPR